MLEGKKILLGVTGGIAAYKAVTLTSRLVQAGAQVRVIMTEAATKLVSPLLFKEISTHQVAVGMWGGNDEFNVEHVAVGRWCDLVVVAPATANIISKMANGLADDLLSTTLLACDKPKIICPAMNTNMYENPITQDNLKVCEQYGMEVLKPQVGRLACGDTGAGKMPEPEELFDYLVKAVGYPKDLAGKKILVTAGPTQESVDPVRYLTNHSTGKMGYAIARTAAYRGAQVTLVTGPTSLKRPRFAEVVEITTAREMFEEVTRRAKDQDWIIKAAAVADYRPAAVSTEKVKKKDGSLTLDLERTDDILGYLGSHKKDGQVLCGFSMETEHMLEHSREKLKKKNLDLIVANNLKVDGAGFGTDTNVVTILTKDQELELEKMSKEEVADRLLTEISKITV